MRQVNALEGHRQPTLRHIHLEMGCPGPTGPTHGEGQEQKGGVTQVGREKRGGGRRARPATTDGTEGVAKAGRAGDPEWV